MELIVYNSHHNLTFEVWVTRFTASGYSHLSHQDGGILDECQQLTAAGLFQCLIICIMNGETMIRMEFIDYSGHHNLTFEQRAGRNDDASGSRLKHQEDGI